MRLKKISIIFMVLFLISCAPYDRYYYSEEYEYNGKEGDDTNWSKKIVYTYVKDNDKLIDYAYQYEDGDSSNPTAFLLYEYHYYTRVDYLALNDRIYKVEYYTDDDIFESDEDKNKKASARKKDINKVVLKQIKYDSYSFDYTSGRITGKTIYYYNQADSNPDNRDVPMTQISYKFKWKWPHQVFEKYGEEHKIYLNESWVITQFVIQEEAFINGIIRLKYKKYYVNNLSEYSEPNPEVGFQVFDKIEVFEYFPNGDVQKISLYTKAEFEKGDAGTPEKVTVYKKREI